VDLKDRCKSQSCSADHENKRGVALFGQHDDDEDVERQTKQVHDLKKNVMGGGLRAGDEQALVRTVERMSSGIVSLRCMPIKGQNKPQQTSNIMKPAVATFKLPTTWTRGERVRQKDRGSQQGGEQSPAGRRREAAATANMLRRAVVTRQRARIGDTNVPPMRHAVMKQANTWAISMYCAEKTTQERTWP
jgi:hypothetical protein